MQEIQIIIDDAHLPAMDAVIAALVAQGFVLVNRLDNIGVLVGRAVATKLDLLRRVPGVQALEPVRDDAGPL